MSFFSGYGNDKELFEIVCAFGKLSKSRYMPTTTPALMDEDFESFASELVKECQSLDLKNVPLDVGDDLKKALDEVKNGKIESPEYYLQVKTLAEVYDKINRETEKQQETDKVQDNASKTDKQKEKNVYKVIFFALAAISAGGIGFGTIEIYRRAR